MGHAWILLIYVFQYRELICMSQFLVLIGTVAIISYGKEYTSVQYVIASVIVFIGTNILEGKEWALLQ